MYDKFGYILAFMTPERKSPESTMISARLPAALVARVDFVARNTEGEIKNRSVALRAALESWLPDQERKLEQLGIITKKAR